jgi:hypothetical protein
VEPLERDVVFRLAGATGKALWGNSKLGAFVDARESRAILVSPSPYFRIVLLDVATGSLLHQRQLTTELIGVSGKSALLTDEGTAWISIARPGFGYTTLDGVELGQEVPSGGYDQRLSRIGL